MISSGRAPARRIAIGLGTVCTAGLLVMGGLARSPAHVERWFVQGVGPVVQGIPLALTRHLPFSLAEWLELAAILVAVSWLVGLAVSFWRGRGHRRRIATNAVLTLWIAAAFVGFLFYVSWGLAYARPPVDERLGWVRTGERLAPIRTDELAVLGDLLVDRVNELYVELHGWPDAYRETRAPEGLPAADRAIDVGYESLVAALGLHPSVARSRGPTKPLASSVLFSYLGIGGFYFPFTGEANIDADAPDWQQPHTMAHEKAHQRFAASENEANFYGFLACIHSEDPFVRYGGWLFAQRQVLSALQDTDPWGFYRIIERRHPGVQRDVLFARAFWSQYDGPVAVLGDAVNDRYLRLNGVEGGVHSYSRSLELVVEWWRRKGVAP